MTDDMHRIWYELGARGGEMAAALPEWQTAVDLLQCAVESGAISADRATEALGAGMAVRSDHANPAVAAIHTASSAGWVGEVAKICGKAGAAGALVDGAVGGLQAAKYVRDGAIDTTQAAKHVAAESGCGFVTSSSGTAGTLAVFMLTGTMGPAALAAGMGASMGSRYLYRQVIGETLPSEEELAEEVRQQAEARQNDEPESADDSTADTVHPDFGDAGTDPDPREWLEEIGPDDGDASETETSDADEAPRGEDDDDDPFEEIGPNDT
jgi:hypothetical protein